MELLAGARSDQDYDLVRSLVPCVDWLGIDPASDFAAAAQIYGACRRSGIIPRGLTGCLISAMAMRTDSAVLACDRYFAALANVVGLTVIQVYPNIATSLA